MAQYLWIVPASFFSLVVIILLMLVRNGLMFRRAFQEAARQLDLEWISGGVFGPGEVTGSIDGEQVDMFVARQGMGSFERMLTVVEVDLVPPLKAEFKLGRENLFNRIGHTFGMHDFEFGDPSFDALYRVSGPDHDTLRAVFNDDARAALVEFGERSSDIGVTPGRLRWERSGRVMDAKVLVRVAKAGVLAAKAMRQG